MSATVAKNERINLRLKQSEKRLIERVATFEGQTVSSFTLSSALATAEKTIHEHESVRLNKQGQGVGQMLLANTLKRTLAVAEEIAIYAMVVDAINKDAECFYRQYGFTHIAKDSRRLFMQPKSL